MGPVKSVNGETGAVTISSDDVPTDGVIWTTNQTINGANLKNARVIVIDSATDITVQISDGSPAILDFTQLLFCQKQNGKAVFSATSGVTIISQGGLLSSGGAGTMCALVKVASGTFILGGALS